MAATRPKGRDRPLNLNQIASSIPGAVQPLIVFDYQTGRSGQHARDFLGAWRGYLCVDDYSGYKALFAAHTDGIACVELGCFAHARRKFYELHAAHQNPLAEEVLQRMAELYAVEAAYSTPFGHAFHADSATDSRGIRPGGRSEATLVLGGY